MELVPDGPTPLDPGRPGRGSRSRPVAVSLGHPGLVRSARRAADEVERRFDEIVALEALRMRRRAAAGQIAAAQQTT